MDTPIRHDQEAPLKGVRSNIVQSIRAYRVSDLQDAAQGLGHHFLYANLAEAQSKQDVLDLIGAQFTLPSHFGKNFDALYDCMTDPLHKSGPQPGFIVVLEQIPAHAKFDKEAREQLLDIFPRSAQNSQAGRANEAQTEVAVMAESVEDGERMPTDKLVDVSPLALRMSSPFNAGYWLAAA
eukprot:gene20328-23092_t